MKYETFHIIMKETLVTEITSEILFCVCTYLQSGTCTMKDSYVTPKLHLHKGPFKCYVMQWEGWGIWIGANYHYEGVQSNVISITRCRGVQFPEKALHNI